MATTSKGIWTPDSTDTYNLTAHLATMAGTIDAALGTGWTSWATAPSGITVGNGTLTQAYSESGGIVQVRGGFLLGSTSSVTGSILVTNPVAASEGYNTPLGSIIFQTAAFARYPGTVTNEGSLQSLFTCVDASGTYARLTGVSGSAPFTWNTGCRIAWAYSYRKA